MKPSPAQIAFFARTQAARSAVAATRRAMIAARLHLDSDRAGREQDQRALAQAAVAHRQAKHALHLAELAAMTPELMEERQAARERCAGLAENTDEVTA